MGTKQVLTVGLAVPGAAAIHGGADAGAVNPRRPWRFRRGVGAVDAACQTCACGALCLVDSIQGRRQDSYRAFPRDGSRRVLKPSLHQLHLAVVQPSAG